MKSKYQNLTDKALLSETNLAAIHEKEATLALLEYLVEIDCSKAYAIRSYSSLFEYIVKELKYSESQASERVNAARLLRQAPGVKDHLESGKLTLTSAAQIQRFIQTEKKVTGTTIKESQTQVVINECLGQSKREVEKTLLRHTSENAQIFMKEKMRVIASDRVEIKFSISLNTEQKLNRVKELIGANSLESIFDQALETLIHQEEKKRGKNKIPTPPAAQPKQSVANNPRYIPVSFKRVLYTRSKGQCEYLDEMTSARCTSKYRLQVDHVTPLARGGTTAIENLRHLCPNHNARAAIEWGVARVRR